MSANIMKLILKKLKSQPARQVDLMKAILVSGYGASQSKIDYEYGKIRRARSEEQKKQNELAENRRRLQKVLSRLKSDGLIQVKEDKKGNREFSISEKGKSKLGQIKDQNEIKKYTSNPGDKFVIISFDIPERLRKKRYWFRQVIKNLGFELVHQSLWMGKVKIPNELLVDLNENGILDYVEIFEITKGGSLEKMRKS